MKLGEVISREDAKALKNLAADVEAKTLLSRVREWRNQRKSPEKQK